MTQPQPTNANGTPSLLLTTNIMARFKPAKVFTDAVEQPAQEQTGRKPSSSTQITGLTFDDRGETLVTSGGDETFRLYNTKTGK
ncbi:member of Set1p complex, histone methyl transferase [Serendipita sp. 401]|nr:member of Set1p complex, histone methyl transferase [Serendipita sp. 401]